MSYQWDKLKKLFTEFFEGKNILTPSLKEIRHCINGDEHVFFLLEDEGGQCCRLEFVVEYSNHRRDIADAVATKTSIREFHTYTKYTDLHWEWRQRITISEELPIDLNKMSDVFMPALSIKPAVQPVDSPVKICSEVTAEELLTWDIKIPKYQRPYSWREKNVRDFLVDISLWQQDKTKDGISYHLGTIILKEQENGCYDVIDGQQRLTTLTIIAQKQGKSDIPLLCSEKEYCSEEIQTILRAREYIKGFETKIELEQIELAVVILGEDQPEDLAYTFFSNSNSTGKHLSDYDLLKTHHLRYVSDGVLAERFSKRWHDLEKSGKQNEVLQELLFRLRKWINNESFPFDANNRESRDIFNHYKSVDLLRDFPVCKIPFRFNSLLSGGKDFFDYTEHYRKKYDVFIEQDEIKMLTAYLSGHSNNVILSGIKAIAFLFFCKFGEMYLKEAVYLLAYRLSELRNRYSVKREYLGDDPIFKEFTSVLDQATNEAQFFALLYDVNKRYTETNDGPTAMDYWQSLHALLASLEGNLAFPKIECKQKQNEENVNK